MCFFEGINAGIELCNAKSRDIFQVFRGNRDAVFSRCFHGFESSLWLLDAFERFHSFSHRRLRSLRLFLSQITPRLEVIHHWLERFLRSSRIEFLGAVFHGFSGGFERIIGKHVMTFLKMLQCSNYAALIKKCKIDQLTRQGWLLTLLLCNRVSITNGDRAIISARRQRPARGFTCASSCLVKIEFLNQLCRCGIWKYASAKKSALPPIHIN